MRPRLRVTVGRERQAVSHPRQKQEATIGRAEGDIKDRDVQFGSGFRQDAKVGIIRSTMLTLHAVSPS